MDIMIGNMRIPGKFQVEVGGGAIVLDRGVEEVGISGSIDTISIIIRIEDANFVGVGELVDCCLPGSGLCISSNIYGTITAFCIPGNTLRGRCRHELDC